MNDVRIVQLKLGGLSSLLTQGFDRTLPYLHDIVQLRDILWQIGGNHARVNGLVRGLGLGAVKGEASPQTIGVIGQHGVIVDIATCHRRHNWR